MLGDGAFYTAMAWQVLILTGSAQAMSLVIIGENLPNVLFVLLGGVAADRLPRRLILLWSDTARAFAVLIIAILAWIHLLQLWHLIVLALAFGVARGFFSPAFSAIPAQLVEVEALSSANSLNNFSQQAGRLIGPALGAILFALTGSAGVFTFDGLTFVISALCLFALQIPEPSHQINQGGNVKQITGVTRQSIKDILSDIHESLSYVVSISWLWISILVLAVGNIGLGGALIVAEPKLVQTFYKEGVWLLGLLGTTSTLGAIIATVFVGQMRHLHRRGVLIYLSLILAGGGLIMFGLPFPHGFAPLFASTASALVGFGLATLGIIWITLLQENVPNDKLGRVTSVDILGSYCLLPVGIAVVGFLTDRIGPVWIFIAGGILNIVLACIALSVRNIRNI